MRFSDTAESRSAHEVVGHDADATHDRGEHQDHGDDQGAGVVILQGFDDGGEDVALLSFIRGQLHLYGLAGAEKADRQAGDGDEGEDQGGHEIALAGGGRAAAEEEDEGHRGGGEDHGRDVAQDGAGGVQGDALLVGGGHAVGQGAHGDADRGVGHAAEDVGQAAPEGLGTAGNVQVQEGQTVGQGKDRRAEQDVRTEAAPAGMRVPLGDGAEHGIVDGVPDAGEQHDGGDDHRRQTDHVRVVNGEVAADERPGELRAGLAEAIADDGTPGQLLLGVHGSHPFLSFLARKGPRGDPSAHLWMVPLYVFSPPGDTFCLC